MMRRCSVASVTKYTQAVLVISRGRIDSEVKDGPLVLKLAQRSSGRAVVYTYDVKILTGQAQQTAERLAKTTEVV
jgi:hypothetical protein